MNYQEIIGSCVTHIRESQRYTPADWRRFINLAMMEMQQQTHVLEGGASVRVMGGQALYSVGDSGILTLTANPRLISPTDPTNVIRLSRLQPSDVDAITNPLTEGVPSSAYWDSAGVIGVYPVPTAAYDGFVLYLHGKRAPREFTMASSLSDSPEFEYIDHPLIVLGALLQAERVDKDLGVSDRVRQQYADGLQFMRYRANNRQGGTKVVKPYGR